MWSDPIHDVDFVKAVVDDINKAKEKCVQNTFTVCPSSTPRFPYLVMLSLSLSLSLCANLFIRAANFNCMRA